ncbi:hypothetical protein CHUAL_006531 [Chamberlinius hualienensis]
MTDEVEDEGAYYISGKTVTNWSETFSCTPKCYFEPEEEGEIEKILALASAQKSVVRCIGCGQSPSDIQFSNDFLISLKKLNKLLEVDVEKQIVHVQSGMTVKKLANDILPQHGLALSVVGAIADISIGGAISTGTHNTGIQFGTMASYVVELQLLTATGEVLTCSREENAELFFATCCGLGAMGVILNVKIQCEKAFNLKQTRYPYQLNEVIGCLKTHLKSSDHFRFNWYPHSDNVVMDHMKRTTEKPSYTSAFALLWLWIHDYAIGFHFLEFAFWISSFFPWLSPHVNDWAFWWFNRTPQIRVDRGDKVLNIECLFKQYVNEWAIPFEKTGVVLYELKEWLAKNPNEYLHFPVEVRFVKAEDFYLSPAYGRDTCYINILSYRPYGKSIPREKIWRAYESIMLKAGGRPHWAKEHPLVAKELRELYPHFDKWCSLRQKYDPHDMFRNAYMDRILS